MAASPRFEKLGKPRILGPVMLGGRMENLLRERIRARLEDLDLNPFEAARRIPADRTFLNDLLIGKKETIRAKVIPNSVHRVF